ncbi:lipase [Melampsora larici-populina 98AG31]|uniref:Carboxylic ester hydrolase n=1 Tax=Melampsora larici-populina (strain 98AG31 / pathotype 3-4-7) TaxID=747676 RepID=F4RV74_MELLP|nr:lipase [Melampsora larici-populina 98AG31]EGG03717.1 lipase [Melampsora larici-populina 98AG31]
MHTHLSTLILFVTTTVNAVSISRNLHVESHANTNTSAINITPLNRTSPTVQRRDLNLGDLLDGTLFPNSDTGTDGQADTTQRASTSGPDVQLDYGNFIGGTNGDVESFTGIPYAEPPIGQRRLTNPIPPLSHYANYDATILPPACPQKFPPTGNRLLERLLTEAELINQFTPLIGPIAVGQEDCLTLDVRRPKDITAGANLPVMVYIYGGAAEFGATNEYDGSALVLASMEKQTPIIYVAMNYRVNAFGFLGGREVGQAGIGNLGLKDQRLALKWVQKYIGQFGGDPSQVTLFGESAGAISVSHQLMAFNGNHEGLFRAAICESGTAAPVETFAEGGGQGDYNELARYAGCDGQSDTLQCLRDIDFNTFYRAMSRINGFAEIDGIPFRWSPRIDGEFVTDTLDGSLAKGAYPRIPIISGDQDDEGTVLSVGLIPLITSGRLRQYLSSTFFSRASRQDIDNILRLYPGDPAAGSPYGTGIANILTPVFKQMASILGDAQFQAPRRKFLVGTQANMPVWSYIDKGYKAVPYLGAFHGTDVPNVFGWLPGPRTTDYQSRWIAFANTMNPNVPGLPEWPNYGKDRLMLQVGVFGSEGTTTDTYRQEAIQYLNDHSTSLAMIPV